MTEEGGFGRKNWRTVKNFSLHLSLKGAKEETERERERKAHSQEFSNCDKIHKFRNVSTESTKFRKMCGPLVVRVRLSWHIIYSAYI